MGTHSSNYYYSTIQRTKASTTSHNIIKSNIAIATSYNMVRIMIQ